MGYRRPFRTLSEANRAAARYLPRDHVEIEIVREHMALSKVARPSDYPVLFHLVRLVPEITSVFDLGGNVGNLFYNYAKYLDFRSELCWTVHDRLEILHIGRQLAKERDEKRLSFTGDLQAADGAEILLASGSLHYFESSITEILRNLSARPKYVLINRTPLTTSQPVATVQDAGDFLVGCRLIDRTNLLTGMADLGYILVDSWDVPELSIKIPAYPDLSVQSYSGLFFRAGPAATFNTGKQRWGVDLA
jgi:putative methyltransferase (TIGR04325 family)